MGKVTVTDPEILARLVADNTPVVTDTLLDICREASSTGDTAIISGYIDDQVGRSRTEIVCGLLSVIMKHPKPDLTVACLSLSVGSHFLPDDAQADVARRFGLSRSAVRQRIKLLREELGIRDEATENKKAMK